MVIKEKILYVCLNTCWCNICNRQIKKGEKFLLIFKNAWKGGVRVNICKDCIIQMFIESEVTDDELKKAQREIIVNNLNERG